MSVGEIIFFAGCGIFAGGVGALFWSRVKNYPLFPSWLVGSGLMGIGAVGGIWLDSFLGGGGQVVGFVQGVCFLLLGSILSALFGQKK